MTPMDAGEERRNLERAPPTEITMRAPQLDCVSRSSTGLMLDVLGNVGWPTSTTIASLSISAWVQKHVACPM